jgi:hypothetical protein
MELNQWFVNKINLNSLIQSKNLLIFLILFAAVSQNQNIHTHQKYTGRKKVPSQE